MHDVRLTPARDDVAAKYLEGKVKAARFVDGEVFEVSDAIAPLRHAPAADAEQMTQALKGERVTVYDRNGEGWAWGQLADDGYVGWIPEAALTKPGATPTHKVAVPRTLAFPGPSIKLPPVEALAMGTKLAIVREDGPFAVSREGWHLPRRHVAPLDAMAQDFVAIAEQFVGTPYLWGGKSSLGIDCSGLVQIALTAAGTGCPRDSDMQQEGLGRELTAAESKHLQRGDLIFWKSHVAIVRDATTIVHANAHHMATAVENTQAAIARIRAAGSGVLAIKRL
ncbi:NlpC/P60 family protein [Bradyrhizobium septentrionale]|uniref:C40 family peptidase n=1 Tax=Bradyrhizobium septentrionale TaxID=1404411 RepID=A0A973ZYN6_9BRAD|nr:NlpC/P60 family protein [Bradyrhizobium septentrionale]UGY19483.1 NlpC/P60 family protein [Bradyrhizobium septentrionale]UGY28252.1 NlpC/P60 family protein [Bradyrhizobium septentrionale]